MPGQSSPSVVVNACHSHESRDVGQTLECCLVLTGGNVPTLTCNIPGCTKCSTESENLGFEDVNMQQMQQMCMVQSCQAINFITQMNASTSCQTRLSHLFV